jgi:hypothetical protein
MVYSKVVYVDFFILFLQHVRAVCGTRVLKMGSPPVSCVKIFYCFRIRPNYIAFMAKSFQFSVIYQKCLLLPFLNNILLLVDTRAIALFCSYFNLT